jgi:hypothetical protein
MMMAPHKARMENSFDEGDYSNIRRKPAQTSKMPASTISRLLQPQPGQAP